MKKIILCSFIGCLSAQTARALDSDDITKIAATSLSAIGVTGIAWYGVSSYNDATKNIVDQMKALLVSTSKYGQNFDVELPKSGSVEKALASNLRKLGKSKDAIGKHDDLVSVVNKDVQELSSSYKTVKNRWFIDSFGTSGMQRNIGNHLAKAEKLSKLFQDHQTFLKGHAIVNSYSSLPSSKEKLQEWIFGQTGINKAYPLSSFKDQADQDAQFIENLKFEDQIRYPELVAALVQCKESKIKKSIVALYQAGKIQTEMQKKHDNDIKDGHLRVLQDRAAADCTIANAKKREADAKEALARNAEFANQRAWHELTAKREANRLKELSRPIEQENNRLQAEKNRLQAEKSRQEAERLRVDSIRAESERTRVAEIARQNRLQQESNRLQQERIRILEQERNQRQNGQANQAAQNTAPSAPPMPADMFDGIPVAVPVRDAHGFPVVQAEPVDDRDRR